MMINLNYDALTGVFTRKKAWRNEPAGTIVNGSPTKDGYLRIRAAGRLTFRSQIAWFLYYGEWANAELDHINGIVTDDRIENLRKATRNQNTSNTKCRKDSVTQVKNCFLTKAGKYEVRVRKDGKYYQLGTFADLEFADLVATEARNKLHGDYANHG